MMAMISLHDGEDIKTLYQKAHHLRIGVAAQYTVIMMRVKKGTTSLQ